jgi:hypothetical protein
MSRQGGDSDWGPPQPRGSRRPQDPFPLWLFFLILGLILAAVMVACISSICLSPTGNC